MNDITFKQKKHHVSLMMNTAMWSPIELTQQYTFFLVFFTPSFAKERGRKRKEMVHDDAKKDGRKIIFFKDPITYITFRESVRRCEEEIFPIPSL